MVPGCSRKLVALGFDSHEGPGHPGPSSLPWTRRLPSPLGPYILNRMDTTRLAKRIALVAGQRDLLAVYVFGSTAGGTRTPLSDLDLAVLLPDSVPEHGYFERRLTLAGEISSLLSEDRVDLVLLNEAPPLLRHRVVTRGTRVYTGNERACSAFERQAISEYLDLAPVLELQHRYLARRVAERRLGARHHHGSVSPGEA